MPDPASVPPQVSEEVPAQFGWCEGLGRADGRHFGAWGGRACGQAEFGGGGGL